MVSTVGCIVLLLITNLFGLVRVSQGFFPSHPIAHINKFKSNLHYTSTTSQRLRHSSDENSESSNSIISNNHTSTLLPRAVSSALIGLIVLSWHNPLYWSSLDNTFHLTSSQTTVNIIHAESLLSPPKQIPPSLTPPAVIDILRDRIYQLRSGVTGEKVGQLRVGDSLFARLRSVDTEMDALQEDIYKEEGVDWEVVAVYPKIFRALSPLFTAYTDRAFPTDQPVDKALRYALRYEVGGFYTGVQELEKGIERKNQRQTQQAFARMSLSYDRYLKAGDLFVEYERDRIENTEKEYAKELAQFSLQSGDKLNYVAPSIEAPGLKDDIILLKGPDKGREGKVLWISKGVSIESANVVVKFVRGESGHSEVKLYPYNIVAKTTPPDVQLIDDFTAAYLASALSSGIMYPLDSFKTRQQTGLKGIPSWNEGGVFGLWKGVFYFIADANDAVYVALYGFIRPALLAAVNIEDSLIVFCISVLAGSLGDAIGSVFRVPMEIIYKQIQTGTAKGGGEVVKNVLNSSNGAARVIVLSWVAVLCRDMPFAGLQIALFDVFKSLLSFLDDVGVNIFVQRALWGALAGSVAAWLTTPFDVLTTNVITAAQDRPNNNSTGSADVSSESTLSTRLAMSSANSTPVTTDGGTDTDAGADIKGEINVVESQSQSQSEPPTVISALQEVGPLFAQTMTDIFTYGGGFPALFQGAVPRVLFFGPAAMIFFASYESLFELISLAREGHAFWQK